METAIQFQTLAGLMILPVIALPTSPYGFYVVRSLSELMRCPAQRCCEDGLADFSVCTKYLMDAQVAEQHRKRLQSTEDQSSISEVSVRLPVIRVLGKSRAASVVNGSPLYHQTTRPQRQYIADMPLTQSQIT